MIVLWLIAKHQYMTTKMQWYKAVLYLGIWDFFVLIDQSYSLCSSLTVLCLDGPSNVLGTPEHLQNAFVEGPFHLEK
jgi:hypothetical protein